jgi:multidrug efflux system membrane fusion protein
MSDLNTAPRNSRRFRGLLIVILLLLAAVLAWWLWPAADGASGQGGSARSASSGGGLSGPAMRRPGGMFGEASMPVPVRVAEVQRGDFPIELKALGTVTASKTVQIRSRVAGTLDQVLFEDGQQVKAGALLAVIDPRPYQAALLQAEGALLQNQSQLKNAETDLARYKGLYAEDSIAKQTLDNQAALVEQYRGAIKTAQAQVAAAKLDLDYTQIRAPFDGRLGLRQLDIGNLVSGNDAEPLVVLTQTKPIDVQFTLPEGELPAVLKRVRDGEKLVAEAWDRGESMLLASGELQGLDNQIDTATGTVRLKARFANEDELLFPNQFVNVRLRVETRQQAVLLPSAALQFGSKGTFVYVVDGENKVQVRQVRVGPGDTGVTLVEEGVEPGERLVLEGTDRLREGSRVEIIGADGKSEAPARPERAAGDKQGNGARARQ